MFIFIIEKFVLVNTRRVRLLYNGIQGTGPVIYWMSRDQRVSDNWALLFALEKANERRVPVMVFFYLASSFSGAAKRHFLFMLEGLKEVSSRLKNLKIPFIVSVNRNIDGFCQMLQEYTPSILVTDFDPLRIKRQWKKEAAEKLGVPVFEVDAHNIVPCWICSPKQEYGAYTFRPKIHALLPSFLEEFPEPDVQKLTISSVDPPNWETFFSSIQAPDIGYPIKWIQPGEQAAIKGLRYFLDFKLVHYNETRNDPVQDGTSGFSPWLHFGHISAQRIVLETLKKVPPVPGTESFLEQLIVRRELADNFCYYNALYDRFDGFPEWGKATLNEHRQDEREFIYTMDQLVCGQTHDALWNAAQMEMVVTGKMHNYMRMYWAKKILEWTPSPEKALETALLLNDQFELDGRDPNGYVGCAWAIGGVHDRPWSDRPVFGKIRYMNDRGAARKFDVKQYIRKVQALIDTAGIRIE